MSLQSGISSLATRVAQEFNALRVVPTKTLSASIGSGTLNTDAALATNVRTYSASSGAAITIAEPTNGTDGQVIRYRVYPSSGSCTITIDSGIRKTTGLSRGPITVPAGEVAVFAMEYVAGLSDWMLTAFTVTEA